MLFEAPILIIGGGVSGLVLAQGLKHRNIPFKVFERETADALRGKGYRFRCEAPGLDALEETVSPDVWNLIEATHPRDSPPLMTVLDLYTAQKKGERMTVKETTPRGQRCYPIDRAWFLELLLLGIEEHVAFGKTFESYELLKENDNGVLVHFEDGSTAKGSLLVAADGVRSRVRRQRFPDLKQIDLERTVCWGRTPLNADLKARIPPQFFATHFASGVDQKHPTRSTLFAPIEWPKDLPGLSAGELSPREDYVFWVLSTEAKKNLLGKDVTAEDKIAWIDTVTKEWHPSFRELLSTQDPANLFFSPIYSVSPDLPQWQTDGRIALLGDAIHAMSPTGGVGGRTAIMDARDLCLAINTSRNGSEEAWLHKLHDYEQSLRTRAFGAVEQAFNGGKVLWAGKDWREYEATV